MSNEYAYFHRLVRHIKKELTFSHPIKIRRLKIAKDKDGDCEFKKDHYLIRIAKDLPEYYAVDVLIHEVAHALAWKKDNDYHGPAWGKAYSKVYKIFLKFQTNEK